MIRASARFGLVAALAAGVALSCACHSSKKNMTTKSSVSMGAINDKCPASGKAVTADAGTATWRGSTIGFCCPACPAKWDAMTPKEKDAFVAQYAKH